MDVRLVPGVGNDEARTLATAGIATVEELRWADADAVAAATGWPVERVRDLSAAARGVRTLTDLPGVSAGAARTLVEHGVADPEALAHADLAPLAVATGLSLEDLKRWKAEAQVAATAAPVEATPGAPQWETPPGAHSPAPPERVLLRAGSADVFVNGEWRPAFPILTARAASDVDALLASAPADAVVLVAGSSEAVVRLGGEAYDTVPLFKERVVASADGGTTIEEVRVKVEEIREKRAAPPPAEKKGLLGRLFGKR